MVEGKRPAETVRDAQGYELKTLAELARHLSELFPPKEGQRPVSRQLLHKARKSWRSRFPKVAIPVTGPKKMAHHDMFRVTEIVEWYTKERWYRIGTASSQPPAEDNGESALAA